MAKIPLRSYNREIEGMIDRGQSAQAISHGRHILKFFPKHIDTYRLLGKAFLELQRYAEAADVLQRVLACVPDDFISQIGMGIIREDGGNLDGAIWHMERAFESQPSNVGVQEELRRLYGRRDGIEPAKIRLTRGALIRMYARGELFQQAIAEARVALAEDAQRIDLEVILARMYYLSGQKVAATEVCTRLLAKLPFCFEANRILAEILSGTTRAEDAKLYLQRVYAMDPYLAHVPQNGVSSAEAPDNSVELDHLEWLSEQEGEQPSEWTKTLGTGWTDQAEPIPDWVTGIKSEPKIEPVAPTQEPALPEVMAVNEPPAEESIPEVPLVQQGDETQIPEWMQQAGWQPSSEESSEVAPTETAPEEPIAEEEETASIEQAEIPEWLAAIAPPEEEPELPEGESEKIDWLADILPPDMAETQPPTVSETGEEPFPEPVEFTTETEGESLAEFPEVEVPAEAEESTSEFQAEQPLEQPENLPEVEPTETAAFAEEVPSIAEIIPDESPIQPLAEEAPVPDWLADLQSSQSESSEIEAGEKPAEIEGISGEQTERQPASEEELPEWLHAGANIPMASQPEPIPSEEIGNEMFKAEVNLGDTQPIKIKREETPTPEIEAAPEDLHAETEPEQGTPMVSEIEGETSVEFETEKELSAEPEIEPEQPSAPEPEEEIPWLQEFDVEKRADEESPASLTAEEGEEMPDWVKDLLGDQGPLGELGQPVTQPEIQPAPTSAFIFGEEVSQPEQSLEAETPTELTADWLTPESETIEPHGEAEFAVPQEQSEETPEEKPEEPAAEIEAAPEAAENDAAFAWLENLAAKQGAAEETLLVSPEQRQEEPPDWIKEEPVETEPATPELQEMPGEAVVPEPPLEMTKEPEEAGLTEEALPEWLRGFGAEEEPVSQEMPTEKLPEEEPVAEESLGWLEELTLEEAGIPPAEVVEEPAAATEPAVEAPSAFKEDASILKVEEPASKDVLPDWLQGLDEEKSSEEALPQFEKEETTAEIESTDMREEWVPEMAAEAPVEEPGKTLEDTSPVRVTPESESDLSQARENLQRAQEALEAHNIERALEHYDRLIQAGEYLEDTIHDLRDALYSYPIDTAIWQALGDACMKSNRLQEALDAYTKAEELLR